MRRSHGAAVQEISVLRPVLSFRRAGAVSWASNWGQTRFETEGVWPRAEKHGPRTVSYLIFGARPSLGPCF